MKKEVKVSVIQFASELLKRDKNIERMKLVAETEARDHGAELIVFPELVNIGYITPVMVGEPIEYDGNYREFASRYVQGAEPIPGPSTEALSEVTRRYGVFIAVGLAQLHPTVVATLYNSGVLIGPKGIIGVHHKMHIPLNEKQFFYPGNTAEVFRTELGNIAIEVCYDGRFPELSRILGLKGAEIICNLWAIAGSLSDAGSIAPDPFGLRYRSYTRAQENGVYFISANRAGFKGETQFLGHSAIAAPNGMIIACSETDEEEVLRVTLTDKALVSYRSVMSIYRDRRPELYGLICKPFSYELVGSKFASFAEEARVSELSSDRK